MSFGARRVDQKGFRCPANTGAAHFGVEDNIAGHVEISLLMHIDMTDTLKMGKNRHAGLFLHEADQTFAAAWHNHINLLV